jgi:hypothetical protein
MVILLTWLLTFQIPLFAQRVYVRGYTKKDGTYVSPHTRAAPRSKGLPDLHAESQERWQNAGIDFDGLMKQGISASIDAENMKTEGWAREHNVAPPPPMINPYRQLGTVDQNQIATLATPSGIRGVSVVNGKVSTFEAPKATETYGERLRSLGVTNNLSGKSYTELNAIEIRVKTAAKLKKFGVDADWQRKSIRELNEMLSSAESEKAKLQK